MKLSTDRILTTHVGSLPRPKALAELLIKKDHGEAYDHAEMKRLVHQAVADIVARQVATGVDVVSDGEASKIGYATYIKDRLTGFGGEPFTPKPNLDVAAYPAFRERMAQFTGPQVFRRLCCTGDITLSDHDAVKQDVANLKAAMAASKPVDAFMPAASPGVVSAFQPNRHYPTHAAYIGAVADAMREEYETIANAGIVVQLDSPDLAMARHTGFQDLTEDQFLRQAEQQIEALNHALANVPASSARLHLCWGNYEGPHDFDIPLQKILPIILKAKPQAISFEAANPRHGHEWAVWKEAKLPDDKVLIPGVIDTCTNYVEHPELVAQRICQYADIVGRERVLAGTDCGFTTFVGTNTRVDPEIAFRKLGSLAEGARIASARLWHKQ
jgi:5-methyltetrahydropteroyltriglutamate--homocysteine methyltransferase